MKLPTQIMDEMKLFHGRRENMPSKLPSFSILIHILEEHRAMKIWELS